MFKVGDKVKLNPNIKEFEWGKSTVGYDEIGTINKINDNKIIVNFESHHNWWGQEKELIPAQFTKKDFKDGDIITTNNGNKLIIVDETFYDLDKENENELCDFTDIGDDLKRCGGWRNSSTDIVKVERASKYTTVYERVENEPKEMTVKEICEALGYEIKIKKED